MKSYLHEDGRWRHKFRQSWLQTAHTCLERARLEHVLEMPEDDSDAACVGTALHTVAEVNIDCGGLTLGDSLDMWNEEFLALTRGEHFRWVKYTPQSARLFGELLVTHWWQQVLPTLELDGVETEWNFVVPLVDDDERVIELSGTADYVRDRSIKDWKTSGRTSNARGQGPYTEWEYRRWAIQPTVYTYALHDDLDHGAGDPCVDFEYVVMHKKGVQRFDVKRGPEHWAWLERQCTDLAKLIELDLSAWPTNDSHALCSERWCPAWKECKGASGIVF